MKQVSRMSAIWTLACRQQLRFTAFIFDKDIPRKVNGQAVILRHLPSGSFKILLHKRSINILHMPNCLTTVSGMNNKTDPDSSFTIMRGFKEETVLPLQSVYFAV